MGHNDGRSGHGRTGTQRTGRSNVARQSRTRLHDTLREEALRKKRLREQAETEQAGTVPGSGVAGDGSGGVAPRGPARHLILEVPNFNNAEDEERAMGSYLRLGTVPDPALAGAWNAPKRTGEDLAAYATFFLDDDRVRDGCPDFVPEEVRQAETAILHTKGGWRDHSDGNRISTTRGDKVEVIRGNYKLVVLGRQDNPDGSAGWDVSGGHIEGPGMSSCIDWVQTFDGTWRVIETSEKGDTITTQHGNSVSWSYGEIQDSTTGSEDETRPATDRDGNETQVRSPNPVITSRTWARRIESYTGSEQRRVPLISDETWAKTLRTKTNVEVMSDETRVKGDMSTTTVAGTMTDTTVAASVSSVTIGAVSDVTVGNTCSMTVGAVEDITLGAMIELTLAAMLEVNVSGSLSINLGHRQEIDLTDALSLTPARQEVAAAISRTSSVESVVSGVVSVKAGAIFLG